MPTTRFLTKCAALLAPTRSFYEEHTSVTEDERPLVVFDCFVHDLADLLATENPYFDRARFYRAAGMKEAADFEARLEVKE